MQTVQKGQRLTASKFNELVNDVNKALDTGYLTIPRQAINPDAFLIEAYIKEDETKDGEYAVHDISVYNNWYLSGIGHTTIKDKVISGDDLSAVNHIALVEELSSGRSYPMSVLTNLEISTLLCTQVSSDQTDENAKKEDIENQIQNNRHKYRIIPLYDILVQPENERFEIVNDYRQAAKLDTAVAVGEGAEPQGAFRWGDIEQKEDKKYGQIRYCHFQFGRKYYTATNENWTVPVKDCTFYLYVIHSNPGGSMIVTNDYGNNLTSTTIPLFSIDDEGNVTNDFRGMPVVPVWSTAQG